MQALASLDIWIFAVAYLFLRVEKKEEKVQKKRS